MIGFGDVQRAPILSRHPRRPGLCATRRKKRIEKRSGTAITSLRVSGGGSQSDAAMQLTADIFGLPTSRPHFYETSGLGAAIDAAVGPGLACRFQNRHEEVARLGKVFNRYRRTGKFLTSCATRVYQEDALAVAAACGIFRRLRVSG